MAELEEPDEERMAKRRRLEKGKRLLVGEKVEVRSLDDGCLGSWHSGSVVSCENGARYVKYDHILVDDQSECLVERISVSGILDGVSFTADETLGRSCGIIRPFPPSYDSRQWCLHYGLCVDAFYNEAWWEGVVFDHEDGSAERKIFFPELGDELKIAVDMLRVTLDWNEATEIWKRRGNWLFLELIEEYEQEWPLCVSIQQIWYDVRLKKGFQKVGNWTSLNRAAWKYLVLEAIKDNFSLTLNELFQLPDLAKDSREEGQADLMLIGPYHDSNLQSDADLAAEVLHADPNSTPFQPYNNEFKLDNLSPPGYDNVPDSDGSSSTSSQTFSEDFSIAHYQKPKLSKITSHQKWLPVGPDMCPGPEFCPAAIAEYALCSKEKKRNINVLIKNVRKHLAYLGWKMEHTLDSRPGCTRRTVRLRYYSPDGKSYNSLRKICQQLRQPDMEIHSSTSERESRSLTKSSDECFSSQLIEQPHNIGVAPTSPSSFDTIIVEPEYSPQAVVDWYLCRSRKGRCQGQKESIDKRETSLKAKKHLAALGWTFWYIQKGTKQEMRYSSPTGKCYYSLRTACKSCIDGGGNLKIDALADIQEESMVSGFQESLRTPNSLPQTHTELDFNAEQAKLTITLTGKRKLKARQERKNKKVSGALVAGNSCSTRALRSRKRAREVAAPSSSRHPRTVLSLLIDNNVVLPRAKIHYRSKKDHHSLAEGRITRDGIKCNCCQKTFTLTRFEAHAGSSCHRPAANIFLEDGRSLLECKRQLLCNSHSKTLTSKQSYSMKGDLHRHANDYICSVCHYGGELLLCDHCPSSFHKRCLGLKDVPSGDWFCPSCCCSICGKRKLHESTDDDMNGKFLNCVQCVHQYHVGCLRKEGLAKLEPHPKENWFCSKTCEKVFMDLHKLLGKAFAVGADMTWTLLKSSKYGRCDYDGYNEEALTEDYCKLNVAVAVMHECFEPVNEPGSNRDLVEDVIFSRRSHLNRLNFQGFYTVLLERNEEMISVATVRVHGKKVAEVPLVGTRFKYRRLGMCRVLMNELEKNLTEIGVERVVLPAVPSVLNTWTTSFGFQKMTESERLEYRDYTFLDFQGTIMCQKFLMKIPLLQSTEIHRRHYDDSRSGDAVDVGEASPVSEVYQAEHVKDSEIMEHGPLMIAASASFDYNRDVQAAPTVVRATETSNLACRPCYKINLQNSFEDTDHEKVVDNDNRNFKCYKRRKTLAGVA